MVRGRGVCPAVSGQVRLWESICALFVPASLLVMAGSPPCDPLRFAACWRPKRATFCALVALIPPRGNAW